MAFTNQNLCRSFNVAVTNSLVSLTAQDCTEVVIYNQGPSAVLLFDNGYTDASNSYIVAPSASFTVRGITNSSALSAQSIGTSQVYYRTQYYHAHVIR